MPMKLKRGNIFKYYIFVSKCMQAHFTKLVSWAADKPSAYPSFVPCADHLRIQPSTQETAHEGAGLKEQSTSYQSPHTLGNILYSASAIL